MHGRQLDLQAQNCNSELPFAFQQRQNEFNSVIDTFFFINSPDDCKKVLSLALRLKRLDVNVYKLPSDQWLQIQLKTDTHSYRGIGY